MATLPSREHVPVKLIRGDLNASVLRPIAKAPQMQVLECGRSGRLASRTVAGHRPSRPGVPSQRPVGGDSGLRIGERDDLVTVTESKAGLRLQQRGQDIGHDSAGDRPNGA